MNQSVDRLNELSADDAQADFLKCCGSQVWAQKMAEARPFATEIELLEAGERIWRSLGEEDWQEAFRAHPRIGETKAAAGQSETAQKWSAQEQSQSQNVAADVMAALAERNGEYERRFGFIFIVCATGKTADEMLQLLTLRMKNTPSTELRVAAEEQRKITQLRLQKLLESKS